jgi:uncharacterized membrane-anchored protein
VAQEAMRTMAVWLSVMFTASTMPTKVPPFAHRLHV